MTQRAVDKTSRVADKQQASVVLTWDITYQTMSEKFVNTVRDCLASLYWSQKADARRNFHYSIYRGSWLEAASLTVAHNRSVFRRFKMNLSRQFGNQHLANSVDWIKSHIKTSTRICGQMLIMSSCLCTNGYVVGNVQIGERCKVYNCGLLLTLSCGVTVRALA